MLLDLTYPKKNNKNSGSYIFFWNSKVDINKNHISNDDFTLNTCEIIPLGNIIASI